MPLLELAGVSAGYQGVSVVRDLDIIVQAGEITSVLGANGAGKTTTMLAISGLAELHGGTIRLDGDDLEGLAPDRIARAGIAHITEDRALFTQLTVIENLRLGGRGDLSRLEEILELFPALRQLQKRKVGTLSGGEQQMLALARGLMSRPRVMLIDEMSLGLAPIIVTRLLATMRRIVDEQQIGILMVEQHVDLALRVADRALVIARGRTTLRGTADELGRDRDGLAAAYLGDGATATGR